MRAVRSLICLGATRKVVRQGLICHHHGVPPEQLRRVTAETALDAVGKESHRGERGDSQVTATSSTRMLVARRSRRV